MIERVVENWLTSVNERQYQIPFCQLLLAEGETVIYISTHGQMEQGKDVITRTKRGVVRAYQLKNGRIALTDWRRHRSEIVELVEYPIDHPSIRSTRPHESVLVTNGTTSDTVINAIRAENRAWKRRRLGHLELVTIDELVARFVRAHGSYLPRSPEGFGKFLDLVVSAGPGPFDKKSFAKFVESVLPIHLKRITFREIQRAVASVVLLTTYIIQRCEKDQNHWAIFEAWTTLGSCILAMQEKHKVPERWLAASFELVQLGALRALENLFTECETNESMFAQGSPILDGHFYHVRITIIAGLLSALSLYYRLKALPWRGHDFVYAFLDWYGPYFRLWGESAVPHLFLAALELERQGKEDAARSLIRSMVVSVCKENGRRPDDSDNPGLANPYYEPEAVLRLSYGLDPRGAESFLGHSYCLEPLVLFIARKGQRQLLADRWREITEVSFASFSPGEPWEFFRWHAESGMLHTKMPEMQQSWAKLLELAGKPVANIPKALETKPDFALFFCLVFPHRFSYDLIKLIDH